MHIKYSKISEKGIEALSQFLEFPLHQILLEALCLILKGYEILIKLTVKIVFSDLVQNV